MKSFVIAIVLMLTCSAWAGTYYVDPLGTDDAKHGVSAGEGAWATIQYAADSVAAGTHTINVAEGTYAVTSAANGVLYLDNTDAGKNLTFVGTGAVVWDNQTATPTAVFRANSTFTGGNVTLNNISVLTTSATPTGAAMIYWQPTATTLTLTGCSIGDSVSKAVTGVSLLGGSVALTNTSITTGRSCIATSTADITSLTASGGTWHAGLANYFPLSIGRAVLAGSFTNVTMTGDADGAMYLNAALSNTAFTGCTLTAGGSSKHVVTPTASAVVTDVAFTNCSFTGAVGNSGTGLYIGGGTWTRLTCDGCTFLPVDGSGIYITGGSTTVTRPRFIDCSFTTITANDIGIGTNTSTNAPTVTSPIVSGCTFTATHNSARGLDITEKVTDLRVSNCTFNNTATAADTPCLRVGRDGADETTVMPGTVIENCVVYCSGTAGSHGMLVGSNANYARVHNVRVYGSQNYGIVVKAEGVVVSHCEVSGGTDSPVLFRGGSYGTIEHCTLETNANGAIQWIDDSSGTTPVTSSRLVLRDNILSVAGASGYVYQDGWRVTTGDYSEPGAVPTITKALAFSSYTYTAGDQVVIPEGITGITAGTYAIAGRTDANTITLATDIGDPCSGTLIAYGRLDRQVYSEHNMLYSAQANLAWLGGAARSNLAAVQAAWAGLSTAGYTNDSRSVVGSPLFLDSSRQLFQIRSGSAAAPIQDYADPDLENWLGFGAWTPLVSRGTVQGGSGVHLGL